MCIRDSINPATGDVSSYDLSKPMTYRYDCGRAKSKVSLDVTVNFIKGISTIDITGNLDTVSYTHLGQCLGFNESGQNDIG